MTRKIADTLGIDETTFTIYAWPEREPNPGNPDGRDQ